FYGPKIDFQIKDALGREWQCGTVQLDFQLPHNFGLTYRDKDGLLKEPVVLHRAIFGSLERFMGILIENYKGAFPFWLAPCQVGIVPIREEHNAYAKEIFDQLLAMGIRVEADYEDTNMNEKVKEYKLKKTPYIIVVGDKEAEEKTVSITVRGTKKQMHGVSLDTFYQMVKKMNDEHMQELITSPEEL
ncbi:MAG: His/Gly/Thr/Pro-type tRNA ligase C-terminal domain-containing protein, partial [Lachnospiraceae bacterium]|nr:His/Gly/Thr/Pro-type tRNA ligase C-terminal domain-containing protein [Lachnospiraceae bacterium]